MRPNRLIFSFFLCLSLSGLAGQVHITGKIHDPIDTVVTLVVPPTSLGETSWNISTRLSSDNEFRFVLRNDLATRAELVHGGSSIPIFIIPDQSFSLELTAGDQEVNGIQFTGPGGADNTFFHEYLHFLKVEAPPVDSGQLARSTAREYRKLMDQNRAARQSFLESYSRTADRQVSPQLLQWLRNDLVYTYATELLRYPSVFRDLHNGTKERNPSARYYDFLQSIRINNPDAILQDSYQRFLESFIIYQLKRPMGWELRTGGERQYALLNRFFFGPPLHYLQHLIFERSIRWLVYPEYMADEYRSFMASEAPELLKQQVKKLRESPPKINSVGSFSITGSPILGEVFQLFNGNRPDTAFFKGRPTLLYFHDRQLSRVGFAVNYLRKLKRNLVIHRDMNICLVDLNVDFTAWQSFHAASGYADQSITHLSMDYFDDLFDPAVEQGRIPKMVLADADGIIVEALNWKPPVKRVLEIIERIPY